MPKIKRITGGPIEKVWAGPALAAAGFDPVKELVALCREVVDVSAFEVDVETLLAGWYRDWEPTADGKGLRVRAAVRAGLLAKALEYTYTKPKSTEDRSSANVGIVVEIKNYVEREGMESPKVEIRDV